MKKQTRIIFGLCALIAGAVACFVVLENIGPYMAKARASEAKTMLSSWASAQNAFYAEYKEYTGDSSKIGFLPEGNLRGKLYTSERELPEEIAQRLPQDIRPFVAKDSYLVIYVMDDGTAKRVFSINQNKAIRQLELK